MSPHREVWGWCLIGVTMVLVLVSVLGMFDATPPAQLERIGYEISQP